jgi:hypothetical protein
MTARRRAQPLPRRVSQSPGRDPPSRRGPRLRGHPQDAERACPGSSLAAQGRRSVTRCLPSSRLTSEGGRLKHGSALWGRVDCRAQALRESNACTRRARAPHRTCDVVEGPVARHTVLAVLRCNCAAVLALSSAGLPAFHTARQPASGVGNVAKVVDQWARERHVAVAQEALWVGWRCDGARSPRAAQLTVDRPIAWQ